MSYMDEVDAVRRWNESQVAGMWMPAGVFPVCPPPYWWVEREEDGSYWGPQYAETMEDAKALLDGLVGPLRFWSQTARIPRPPKPTDDPSIPSPRGTVKA